LHAVLEKGYIDFKARNREESPHQRGREIGWDLTRR
jgi:hypothetical protein